MSKRRVEFCSIQFSLDTSDLFTTATLSTTRGHNYKLFKPQATSRVRSTFFTVPAINDWNSLPNHIVNAPTLNFLDSGWSTLLLYVSFCYVVANLLNSFCTDQALQAP